MEEFMLIFRHEDGQKLASPEQLQHWMQQTMDWIGGIAAQNKYLGGNGLPFDDARVLWSNQVVTNGPFGDIKETIGGYIVVKTSSADEAVELARGCPVLQGEGNSVEIRRLARGDEKLILRSLRVQAGAQQVPAPRAELLPHLFRTEFRKIVSVLGRRLGLPHLQAAEDIVSDTFLLAYESWPYQGLPENPTAWLYTVAQNKAKNYLRRQQVFNEKVAPQLAQSTPSYAEPELDLSETNIRDSQLRMLFALCHPSLSAEAQIGLALRILCGFGIEEIADAFLTNKETIQKRLYRAKETLRQQHFTIEVPSEADLPSRLASVLTTLYLLFSEGYYSESQNAVLREELCLEAMRLTYLLLEYPPTNLPPVNALLALMCFHASRFAARKSGTGEFILYQDQDETLWNQELIAKGTYYLRQAARGSTLSRYHLEATIAYWHTIKADTPAKWEAILQLYNQLLIVEYSPVAALNRTFALAKVYGNERAIIEAEKLNLTDNQYYFTLLGELYQEVDPEKSRRYFQQALGLAKTQHDRELLSRKLASFLSPKVP